jgi:hypothetical protein
MLAAGEDIRTHFGILTVIEGTRAFTEFPPLIRYAIRRDLRRVTRASLARGTERSRLLGEGAFLLDGRVEQATAKGFAFLVHSIGSLRNVLFEARVPVPRVVSASRAFLRAGKRGRRAG